MANTMRTAAVHNEGCDLTYFYQGTGPLLMFIPGGGGIGKTFLPIFKYVSHKYTVCTLDRRQSGQSLVETPRALNPSQQVRDIIAVMKDLGFTEVNLFGNSGGAILALHFAACHPELLDRVVAHEGPTSCLLADAAAFQDFVYNTLSKAHDEGPAAAFADFRAMQKGFDNFPTRVTGGKTEIDNFLQNEFIIFGVFCPDLRRVRDNGVKVAVAAGARSEDAWYARTTLEQRKILGCRHYVVPGNHAGFELEPETFAAKLMAVLHELDEEPGRIDQ